MRKLLNTMKRFGRDEEGAALAEYAVLLGVLVGGVLVAITALGVDISARFTAMGALINPPAA